MGLPAGHGAGLAPALLLPPLSASSGHLVGLGIVTAEDAKSVSQQPAPDGKSYLLEMTPGSVIWCFGE